MKKLYFIVALFANACGLFAQDTFSIVAVDSATGEVGSAGTSCLQDPNPINGCLIISDVVPGKGAIHTQALWDAYNQQDAHGYMLDNYSPADIIYNTNLYDDTGDSTIRQYGVALFDTTGKPATAAYTGINCSDYKGHIVGSYYTIQGNILLGPQILDSMQARFLNTHGDLAERLMAALQGANVPGADSRCLDEGVPGQSSFVRVAKPNDDPDKLYLDQRVISRPTGMSPIDSLQTLFNVWRQAHPLATGVQNENIDAGIKVYPNPAQSICNIQFTDNRLHQIKVLDMLGNVVLETECRTRAQIVTSAIAKGAYFIQTENSVHKLIVQ